MLTVATWRWGDKYSKAHVENLRASVARNLTIPHRFVVITDDYTPQYCRRITIDRPELLKVSDGCYARLRMFDPEWRRERNIGDLLCLDLDMVITGSLDAIASRPEPFVILHGAHFNPCKFNGSVMLIRDGAPREVWDRFDVGAAHKVATADGTHRGTDQTWIAHVAPKAAGYTVRDGVYGYGKPGWPGGDSLPAGARIVAFPGSKDPSRMTHIKWIRENWRA